MSTKLSNLSFNPNPIFYYDSFVYHLTRKEYMKDIVTQGLKPLCGENSKSIGDTRKAIYFFDCLQYLYDWCDALYSIENYNQLELLRFNLKRRKWYRGYSGWGEGYLERKVLPERIDYAIVSKASPEEIKLKWKKLDTYPLIS